MNINKILSKNNQNLSLTADKEYQNYYDGSPFPNIVIENFFDENYLNQVLSDFPDLSKIESSQKYSNKNEVKYANNDYTNYMHYSTAFSVYGSMESFIYFDSSKKTNELVTINELTNMYLAVLKRSQYVRGLTKKTNRAVLL